MSRESLGWASAFVALMVGLAVGLMLGLRSSRPAPPTSTFASEPVLSEFVQPCPAVRYALGGDWKPVATAPRNGTVIEMMQAFGAAPWYGIYKWSPMGDGLESPMKWMKADEPNMAVTETPCLFWRQYSKTGKYVDPTNGAQSTKAYWCEPVGARYDAKNDRCYYPWWQLSRN